MVDTSTCAMKILINIVIKSASIKEFLSNNYYISYFETIDSFGFEIGVIILHQPFILFNWPTPLLILRDVARYSHLESIYGFIMNFRKYLLTSLANHPLLTPPLFTFERLQTSLGIGIHFGMKLGNFGRLSAKIPSLLLGSIANQNIDFYPARILRLTCNLLSNNDLVTWVKAPYL